MTQKPQRPKGRAASPGRRAGAAAQAAQRLDARGVSLAEALPSIYADMPHELGAALDEVTLTLDASLVPEACRRAKQRPELAFDYLRSLSAVDYVERIEINYHLFSLRKRHKMVVKTNLAPDEPRVGSVMSVWRGADWFEREAHDLFGVRFDGHPNLSPLLLYEGFEGHPGLKSFPFHDYKEW